LVHEAFTATLTPASVASGYPAVNSASEPALQATVELSSSLSNCISNLHTQKKTLRVRYPTARASCDAEPHNDTTVSPLRHPQRRACPACQATPTANAREPDSGDNEPHYCYASLRTQHLHSERALFPRLRQAPFDRCCITSVESALKDCTDSSVLARAYRSHVEWNIYTRHWSLLVRHVVCGRWHMGLPKEHFFTSEPARAEPCDHTIQW
jgi:hypothetical protein